MKIRPIDERILIKPLKEEERRVGGIIIPDTAKERPQMGEVVEVGDDVEHTDRKQKKLSEIVKKGDHIVYARYGGTEFKMDNEEYLLVSRSDILAVVQK
ncbi:MAG: co-chaperone GroES [Calditrichota bacterium]